MFQHEYGHYRQGQRWGPAYLLVPALSSFISALTNDEPSEHNRTWAEQNANKRGFEYFHNKTNGDFLWDKDYNKIHDEAWLERFQTKPNDVIYYPPAIPALPRMSNLSGFNSFMSPLNNSIYPRNSRKHSMDRLRYILQLNK